MDPLMQSPGISSPTGLSQTTVQCHDHCTYVQLLTIAWPTRLLTVCWLWRSGRGLLAVSADSELSSKSMHCARSRPRLARTPTYFDLPLSRSSTSMILFTSAIQSSSWPNSAVISTSCAVPNNTVLSFQLHCNTVRQPQQK